MPVTKTSGQGRRKGSLNRKTKAIAVALAETGLTPLEYLCSVFQDEKNELGIRVDAAKSAAPYIHPRLSAVTMSGDKNNPLEMVAKIVVVPVQPVGTTDTNT